MDNAMNWIDVSSKIPDPGQRVLVVGFLYAENGFPLRFEETIGIVLWENADKSQVDDTAYYTATFYRYISKWMPEPEK